MLQEAVAVLSRNTCDFSQAESSTLRLKIGLFGATLNSDRDYINVDIAGDDSTVDVFDTRSENNIDNIDNDGNDDNNENLKGEWRNDEDNDGNDDDEKNEHIDDHRNNKNNDGIGNGRLEIRCNGSDGTYDDSEKSKSDVVDRNKNYTDTNTKNASILNNNNNNYYDDSFNNVYSNNNDRNYNEKKYDINNVINLRIEKVMRDINEKSSKSRTEEYNINNPLTVFESKRLLQQTVKINFCDYKKDSRREDLLMNENKGEESIFINEKMKIIDCQELEHKTEISRDVVKNAGKTNFGSLNNSLSTLEIKPSNLYNLNSVIKNSERKMSTVKNSKFKKIQKIISAPSPTLFGIKGNTKELSAKKLQLSKIPL
jgi:hypothetical protein